MLLSAIGFTCHQTLTLVQSVYHMYIPGAVVLSKNKLPYPQQQPFPHGAPTVEWHIDIHSLDRISNMESKIADPLSYAADADESVLEEIARLDGLRVRSDNKWRMMVMCIKPVEEARRRCVMLARCSLHLLPKAQATAEAWSSGIHCTYHPVCVKGLHVSLLRLSAERKKTVSSAAE